MTLLVLSISGSDRPGLTNALASAVRTAGGNWLESHLSLLGGLYVGSVLIELAERDVEVLRSSIASVDAQGLEVRIAPAHGVTSGSGEILEISLVGQDQPGIVSLVTSAIGKLGANIETFETWLSCEAHSGASLFHMAACLRLTHGLSAATVQSALEAISGEIMVDIEVVHKA